MFCGSGVLGSVAVAKVYSAVSVPTASVGFTAFQGGSALGERSATGSAQRRMWNTCGDGSHQVPQCRDRRE
jgi:hypothetical protein